MDFKEQEADGSFYGQQAHMDKDTRTQEEQRAKLLSSPVRVLVGYFEV